MISQRQLMEWSQEGVSRFQSLMPAVEAPYLEIIINDEKYWRISLEDLDTIGTIIHSMERFMAMDVMTVRLRDRIHQ